jgi:hypothetical protein
MRSAAAGLLLASVTTATSGAEDLTIAAQRLVEMPAHRALMNRAAAEGYDPMPFAGDGCSGGLSLVWRAIAEHAPAFAREHGTTPPFEGCCDAHDRVYHVAGGAREAPDSFDARLRADEAMRACVMEVGAMRGPGIAAAYAVPVAQVTAAYGAMAEAMFQAVRLGGGPCTGLPWRWGFGFGQCLEAVKQ